MGNNFHIAFVDFGTLMKADHLNPIVSGLDRGITYMKNVIVHCDGEISWNPYTAYLSWNDTMRIHFTRSDGTLIQNTVDAGSIYVADGQFAYVDLDEVNNTVVTVQVATINTGATSNTVLWNRVLLGYRNVAADAFFPVHLQVSFDASTASRPYDIGATFDGYPPAEGLMVQLPMVRTVVFPEDLANSQGYCAVDPKALAVFSIKKNGTQFATMRFAAGENTATFVCAYQTELEAGDVLTVTAPNPQDDDLQDVGFILAGIRGTAPPAAAPPPTTTTQPPSATTTTTTA
jgi:hypothetical protein